MTEVVHIPVEQISADPNQPRRWFDKEGLQTLAANITEHGVLEPILVRTISPEAFIIIAGERRYRATVLAQLPTIPALIRDDMGAHQLEEVAISENTARVDLNAIEEARSFQKLAARDVPIDDIANKVGKTVDFVQKRLSLLTLAADLQELVIKGHLGPVNGALIAQLNGEYQSRAIRALTTQDLSYNGLREIVNRLLEQQNGTELFTEEQAPRPSEEARKVRYLFDRSIDMAIDAMKELLHPATLQILPSALGGDTKFILARLKTLESEARRLRSAVEAAQAQRDGVHK